VPHFGIPSGVARLDQLTRALRREELLTRQGQDPLLYLGRQVYCRRSTLP
jgi:hypothetical protein